MNKLTPYLAGGAAALLLATTLLHARGSSAEEMHVVAPPSIDVPHATTPQVAVLSGGCFWGVQGVFEHVKGVTRVLAGYTGGAAGTAQYDTVSEGDTGHAESVQIFYDPQKISYGHILQIFFSVALDPTMVNAQGPDTGTQYRSEIWYATPEQQKVAQAYIAQLNAAHSYAAPIATRVDALRGFYPAEGYHQDFLEKNPDFPYIVYNDMPKVQALKVLFPADYTARAVLSGAKS
jgi:peptide-methionine (S)-S-oxide reductase